MPDTAPTVYVSVQTTDIDDDIRAWASLDAVLAYRAELVKSLGEETVAETFEYRNCTVETFG